MNKLLLKKRLLTISSLTFVTAILLSCALPVLPTVETQIQPTPTESQQILPPALVEVSPLEGSLVGLDAPITFYFSQPMELASVEAAFFGLPSGTFAWRDDLTLIYTPSPSLPTGAEITIAILTSAKAANGLALPAPVTLTFHTSPTLRALNLLPIPDSQDISPSAVVAVTFNQPVVALGAVEDAPEAFLLDPPAEGRGEWLSTSTYVFHPEPALAGGETYTARLNTDLVSATGIPLETAEEALVWSFETATPRLVSAEPSNEQRLGLDPRIKLTFNQSMDANSVEKSISFLGPSGVVEGAFAWNEEQTAVTYIPASLLERNALYTLTVTTQAAALSGTPIALEHLFEYTTYDDFAITNSDPSEGGVKGEYYARIFFSAPLKDAENLGKMISINPEVVNLNFSVNETTLNINGFFTPETDYSLTVSPTLTDQWDQPLNQDFRLNFRTPPATPSLSVPYWGSSLFARPDEAALLANAVNIQEVDVSVASITLDEFRSLTGANGYQNLQTFAPQNPTTYSQAYNLAPSRSESIALPLAAKGEALPPGLYHVCVDSPQLNQAMGAADNDFSVSLKQGSQTRDTYLVVASDINLLFKHGATDVLVWAIDLRDTTPVADAPVKVYDEQGTLLASGQTDQSGLWQGEIPFQHNSHNILAMLGEPGEENFGLALSTWNPGISSWEFGIPYRHQPPEPKTYLYTDRPIYRPGQTIYFRGVVRQAFDGRYELPEMTSVILDLEDWEGHILQSFNLPLSPYGSFNGEYKLSDQAQPGWYSFNNSELGARISFDVAEYRKPEFELGVAFDDEQSEAGEHLKAEVNARYYFGAPAADMDVKWSLYEHSAWFSLPGYQTGLVDDSWLEPYWANRGRLGKTLQNGEASTDLNGNLLLALEQIPSSESPRSLTLEVTAQDESGFPVSARAETFLHPGNFYIGLRPDQWIGQSGNAMEFEVFSVNWERLASPSQALEAEFKRVEWKRKNPPPELNYEIPTYEPVYTLDGSSTFATGPDGKARLSFTPSQPGTYLLDVSGEGARTQILIWVGGGQNAVWPDLANNLLRLSPDQDSYKPGQTAQVFIPNPFGKRTPALVTIERGKVQRAETIILNATGSTYSMPLTEAEAPNVYVAVTLLGEQNEFRQGYATISVEPTAQELNVELTAEPEVNQPRGELTLQLRVTDHNGNPKQGEFSLSVVDKAVLALADSNSTDILSAFYGRQSLGISTSLSVAVHSGRFVYQQPGLGGGGDGAFTTVREQFPDTAYWNPTLVTDSNGFGQVKLTLPDSLTTWFIEARGLTLDTRVGQSETEVVTTKPLLIRPVTPRFLVDGDHVELAAIVHNNTANNLQATVQLEGSSFTLDEPEQASQSVNISANSRVRVAWWGVAGGAAETDLTFSVTSNSGGATLQDAAKPSSGALPILSYVTPQTFVTAGMLTEAGARQETINLPRTFSPTGGGLEVEMAPSLAATLLTGLEALPPPACACNSEEVLSYLLPNLEALHALQSSGMEDPALKARLDQYLKEGLEALVINQNEDGGWGWLKESRSDPYISAYVLFGLGRARLAGIQIPDEAFANAHAYLQATLPDKTTLASLQPWELDRLTFSAFSLQQSSGLPETALLDALYDQRDKLSPWAQALLSLGLQAVTPEDPRARDLLSNLESTAIRTASSANWESETSTWRNPGTPLYTTAVIVYTLAQQNAAAPVLIEAVRYLITNRDARGIWGSSYESAWSIMALTEAMKAFGELQADFTFTSSLNGAPLTVGDARGANILTPVSASVPLDFLSPVTPNALLISREAGLGRLYYRGLLRLERPVESVQPLNRGVDISRAYFDAACEEDCQPLTNIQLASAPRLKVRLTLILPNDVYFFALEDFIPAGTEILNQGLKTSQQGEGAQEIQAVYDPDDPFRRGWGWWYFSQPQVYDDHIQWMADFLPAGAYDLTYTLIPTLAGEFRVLPAHAWLSFFPDVQGTSAGTIFTIEP